MILRDSDAACMAELEDGTVRAVVTAQPCPRPISLRERLQSVASLPPELRAIVVSRDGPDPSALIAAIDAKLDEMRADGTLGRYSTARFGVDLTVQR